MKWWLESSIRMVVFFVPIFGVYQIGGGYWIDIFEPYSFAMCAVTYMAVLYRREWSFTNRMLAFALSFLVSGGIVTTYMLSRLSFTEFKSATELLSFHDGIVFWGPRSVVICGLYSAVIFVSYCIGEANPGVKRRPVAVAHRKSA